VDEKKGAVEAIIGESKYPPCPIALPGSRVRQGREEPQRVAPGPE